MLILSLVDQANQPTSCSASPSQVREGLCIVGEKHQTHLRDDRVVMLFVQGIGLGVTDDPLDVAVPNTLSSRRNHGAAISMQVTIPPGCAALAAAAVEGPDPHPTSSTRSAG